MVPAINRPAVVKVNLEAIKHNFLAEKAHIAAGQKLFCVVKANAYGHGAVAVAKTCEELGADGFCVAVLDEALQLRKNGITKPILVLGVTPASKAALASENDISLTAPSLAWLKEVNCPKTLKIHLAIDSGMGRIGFSEDDEFKAANDFLKDNQQFFVEGMFTHFASADSADSSYYDYQVTRFEHMKSLLTIKPKWIHAHNTAASIFGKTVKSDIARFGIGLYGLNPSDNPTSPSLKPLVDLKPALSVETELVYVKKIHPGMGVSYGSTFKADKDEWIGTLPIGYADGFIRKMSGFKVKVGDTYCPIVGRICMDQMMVKMPQEMPVGTKVEVISSDPNAENNIKKLADYLDTIHYEVACVLSDRLPREYN
ncbi:MAG: alanine racemase [Lactobacillus sp.]|nr:alanine racemase [Lactobacillus sp.]